ncbi:MAG: PDZ domain-containing protein [Erysipelotrichales bacterium]|nr:PDZ domain-containing protein [Erysipelotrichales bacterium]
MKKTFNFIKENLVYILIFVILLTIIYIDIPYSVYSPGGVINIENRLSNVSYGTSGSFNMTYVNFRKCNIPTCLLGFILPEWDIIDNKNITLSNETINESLKRDKIYLQESVSNATYVAYTHANKDISIKNENIYITIIADYADTNLSIGDEIISINNQPINTYEEIINIINNYDYKEKLELKVLRDNKETNCYAIIQNIENSKKIGIGTSSVYEFNKSPDIKYSLKSSEAGPSGGLILALAIYNSLIKEDITKGLKISGTGTITKNGEVGSIGGLKYKLSGAVKNKSDIFIVPEENYYEALEIVKKYNYQIKIIKAKSFEDVLAYLENM